MTENAQASSDFSPAAWCEAVPNNASVLLDLDHASNIAGKVWPDTPGRFRPLTDLLGKGSCLSLDPLTVEHEECLGWVRWFQISCLQVSWHWESPLR